MVSIVIPTCKTSVQLDVQKKELELHDVGGMELIYTCTKGSSSVNRNIGLNKATGDYIIMTDDDTTGFYDGWYNDLVKPLTEDNNIRMVSARLLDGDGKLALMQNNDPMYYKTDEYFSNVGANHLPTACVAFRKKDIADLFFDEEYVGSGFEDTDFCNSLLKKFEGKCEFGINNSVRIVHINERKNQLGYNWERNMKLYARKWGYGFNIQLQPTRMSMIDVGRHCNEKCEFCYYIKQPERFWNNIESLKAEVDASKARGNTWIAISGGEPSIYPDIGKLIEYIHSVGMKVEVITNGIKINPEMEKADSFLLSMHGMEETHDKIVGVPGARKLQIKFMDWIKTYTKARLRVNYVLTNKTMHDIIGFAQYIAMHRRQVSMVNFINFNPFYEWSGVESESQCADMDVTEATLPTAINILEKNNIDCNLRYYPICRINQTYWKNVCNDPHVLFDPWEWDYSIMPKDVQTYFNHGLGMSQNNELKTEPCANCKWQWVCGGINRNYTKDLINKICKPEIGQHEMAVFTFRKDNPALIKGE